MRQTGRRNVAIAREDDGMLPRALDEAAAREPLWGVFLMPSLHNPRATVMPLARRQALVLSSRRLDAPDRGKAGHGTPPVHGGCGRTVRGC